MKKKPILILAAILVLVSQVSAFYVGVAPSQRDGITAERGETYQHDLYLTSDVTEPVRVEPQVATVVGPNADTFAQTGDVELDELSSEDLSSWISFDQEQYTIGPEVEEEIQVEGGGSREANSVISYTLDVPRDAEPGYHVARIDLEPVVESGSGNSLRTIAMSQYTVVFKVPGDAQREITFESVEALRTGDDSALVRADMRNTGTVTTVAGGDLNITSGSDETELEFGTFSVEPGENRTVETTWERLDSEIEAGNYRLQGNFNYVTGRAFINEQVSITDFIQIDPSQNNQSSGVLPEGQDGQSVPVWLVAMFLVTLGAIMYSFKIDPLLIILVLAALGGSLLVWFSSLPAYYVGGILIVSVAAFYHGWL